MKIVGKTIKKLDKRAVNCWTLEFTDGTAVEIEVEGVYPSIGLYGLVMRKVEPPPRGRTRTNRVQDGCSAS